jgi:hypothetical protein
MFRITRSSLLLAAALLATAAPALADETFKLERGFTRLDTGKDLEGWTGNTTGWEVVDGAIHLNARQAKADIYSKTTHSKNCVIRMEFKASANADSGVYIHGKQLQVRDYPKAGPKEYAGPAKPAGQWNELEFDLTDGVAVVKLNGEVIEKAWKIGNAPTKGIGLQRERGDFDFRHIRIMEKTK